MTALLSPLAWLGRQGTRAVAASVFLGLALPPLAAVLKPLLAATIFMLLVLAFLRVDPASVRAVLTRPAIMLAATLWIMVALPLALGAAYWASGLGTLAPGLMLALVLQAAAPPIMSAPAFAALMGLDAALSLTTLVLAVAVTPFTAPAIAELFVGEALALDGTALALRLFLLLGGSATLALAIRFAVGTARLEAARGHIDGLSVLMLFVFAVALMDGVAARFLADPALVVGLVLAAFALALALVALTTFVFRPVLGLAGAFALALAAGHRNMGLMLAAVGGSVPDLAWLWFALAQFPIYLVPWMLGPVAARIRARDPGLPGAPAA